jgi:putative pyrroloquinoline-quinone binding quinoprotein
MERFTCVRPRLAIVLAVLAAIALVGALLHRGGTSLPIVGGTTSSKPKPDPNRVITSPGPLPGGLLIADRGNDRILLVNPKKRWLWYFPNAHDRARGVHLFFDDDTFVEPGGKALITNEEDNHDILSIDIKTHRVTNLYGHPGVKGSTPGYLNTPDDAYVLPDGTMTVADAYNCRILFIRNHRIVRQIGTTDVCTHDPPHSIYSPNGDTPLPDGGVLVSEITGSWIDNFSKTGKLRWSFQAPVSYPSDPQLLSGGRILMTDYASPGAALIVNERGRILWRYRPTAGAAELDHPSLAIMLPNGDIAVNDDYNDRVVIIDPKKNRIVWQYGHKGQPGRGGGFLHTPDGMDYVPLGPHEKPLWQLVHHP